MPAPADPADHPVWCEGDHEPPIRVSGIQSGSWSGPVGSTQGQQPFRRGQLVREEQPTRWGWTPQEGWIEMRARAVVSPRSMVSLWMVGREEVPERSAEICVMEAFGDAVTPGGPRRWAWACTRSATLTSGRTSPRSGSRSTWRSSTRTPATGRRSASTSPWTAPGPQHRGTAAYPLQLMLAVFDFPDRSVGDDGDLVPELVVDWVRGWQSPAAGSGVPPARPSAGGP